MPASVVDDGSLYIRAVNRVMFEPRDVQWMSLVDLNGCITRFTDGTPLLRRHLLTSNSCVKLAEANGKTRSDGG